MKRLLLFLILGFLSQQILKAQDSLDLEGCIAIALEHNLEMARTKLQVEDKRLSVQIAKNERLPNLNANSSVFSNFGQSQDIFGNSARNDNLNGSLAVSSSYSLVNHGRLKNAILKADLEWQAGQEDVELQKRNITLRVIQAYFNYILQVEVQRASDSAMYFANQQMQKVKSLTELGTAALSEQYEAEANYAREQQKLQTATLQVNKARLELNQSLGIPEEEYFQSFSINLFHKKEYIQLLESNPDDSHLFDEHPLIRKYQMLHQAMLLQNKVIRAQLYPAIDANLSLGTFYFNNLSNGFLNRSFLNQLQGNFSQQIGLSIQIPIFNRYNVRNAVARNNVQILDNQLQLEIEKRQVKNDLEKSILELKDFQKQLQTAENAFQINKRAFDLSLKSYEAGKISIYDLNTSRANLLNMESQLINSRYNLLFSRILVNYQLNAQLFEKK